MWSEMAIVSYPSRSAACASPSISPAPTKAAPSQNSTGSVLELGDDLGGEQLQVALDRVERQHALLALHEQAEPFEVGHPVQHPLDAALDVVRAAQQRHLDLVHALEVALLGADRLVLVVLLL